MREHRLEVADVFRRYEKEFFAQWGHVLGPHQRKAFEAIHDCRTAALGGHVEYVEQCDTCGHRVISYNSCRDRHCPKCQALARAKWLAERETELLPAETGVLLYMLARANRAEDHQAAPTMFKMTVVFSRAAQGFAASHEPEAHRCRE